MSKLIEAKNLTVGYKNKSVVSDINFTLNRGQILTLMGQNGSGKSTILKTITGQESSLSGQILIKDKPTSNYQPKELAKIMAVVLTDKISGGQMTARQVVALGRSPYLGVLGKMSPSDQSVIDEALNLVDAVDLADRYFHQLSDGQKQKIMIARALAQEPEILVLDEPTSYLDVRHKVEILKILSKLSRQNNLAVIMALHDIDLALKVSDEILFVNNKQITAQGLPEELIKDNSIDQLYQIESAHFSGRVHNLELLGRGNPDVFVLAGAGSGAPVYRFLERLGLGFITGVLPQNDIDYQIAQTTASQVISTAPYQTITNEDIKRAVNKLDDVACVIDTGFPLGPINQLNLEIIKNAQMKNIPVYSLRPDNNYNVPTIKSMTELEKILKENLL